jgi:hypothetical protein
MHAGVRLVRNVSAAGAGGAPSLRSRSAGPASSSALFSSRNSAYRAELDAGSHIAASMAAEQSRAARLARREGGRSPARHPLADRAEAHDPMRGLTKTKASAVPQSPRTGGGDVHVTLMMMKKAADAAGRTRIFYRSAATPGCQSLPANPERDSSSGCEPQCDLRWWAHPLGGKLHRLASMPLLDLCPTRDGGAGRSALFGAAECFFRCCMTACKRTR